MAMDPTNGEVLALGSYPSFDANVFAKPLSQENFDKLNSEENGAPLFNRAIAAAYPTGSMFKPITAMASLRGGHPHAAQTIFDDGKFKLGPQTFQNARDASYGLLNLSQALKVSSDVFFYTLGERANSRGPIIQEWAHKLGLGHKTGIDIPGEFGGLVPDRRWRDAGYAKYQKCVKREKVPAQTFAALKKCGGIERPWSTGDNVNLAVGQGDLQATPLQLATAYSAIANGGRVVRPHLAMSVEDGLGARSRSSAPPPSARQVLRDRPGTILQGLHRAASEPGRHLGRRLLGLCRREAHRVRQDRYRGAAGAARPVLVRLLRASSQPPNRRRRDRGEGRLRRRDGRAGRAPDPLQLVRPRQGQVPRRVAPPHDERPPPSSPPPSRPRRSCRASGACAWTRCCCWRRSGSWPAR